MLANKYDCSGCHACYSVCPIRCIEMKPDEEGFLRPHINEQKCTDCGLCERVCPVLKEYNGHKKGTAYACISKNDAAREKSSSGGIFSLIAEHIIEHNGVVFGAAFDSNFNVHHIKIEEKNELDRLQGSKYVQSDIGDTYEQAKAYLKSGKIVLFTGTPCQISGLKHFLGKDYDNLITQDIICHGVPSPKVWQKYLEYQRASFKGNINGSPSFRLKDSGWSNYSVFLGFDNNSKYCRSHREDLFMRAFLNDLCLRPSCYCCHSKSVERESDITLGDFWGIENAAPDMYDDKGVSLVLINSKKGGQIFDAVSDKMRYKKVDFDTAIKSNPSVSMSARLPRNRDKFMRMIDYDFEKAVKVCTKRGFISRFVRKAKRILFKVDTSNTQE